MVKIRLARIGRHMDPSYRIVVADSRCPHDGRCIEQIGHYDPMLAPEKAVLNEEKTISWLLKGAVPSDSVKTILSKKGIYKAYLEKKASETAGK